MALLLFHGEFVIQTIYFWGTVAIAIFGWIAWWTWERYRNQQVRKPIYLLVAVPSAALSLSIVCYLVWVSVQLLRSRP
jgi:hypothetical protein